MNYLQITLNKMEVGLAGEQTTTKCYSVWLAKEAKESNDTFLVKVMQAVDRLSWAGSVRFNLPDVRLPYNEERPEVYSTLPVKIYSFDGHFFADLIFLSNSEAAYQLYRDYENRSRSLGEVCKERDDAERARKIAQAKLESINEEARKISESVDNIKMVKNRVTYP